MQYHHRFIFVLVVTLFSCFFSVTSSHPTPQGTSISSNKLPGKFCFAGSTTESILPRQESASKSSLIKLQFLYAVRSGNLSLVRELNTRYPDMDLANAVSPGGTPAIWSAAFHNETKILQYLIHTGVKLDATNVNGTTAAYVAAQNGALDALELLIEAGTDLNIRSKRSSTILGVAVQQSRIDVVKRLLKENIDDSINSTMNTQEQSPLLVASYNGDLEIVQELLKHKACVNHQDQKGSSPLFAAAQEGYYDILWELLSHGANVSLPNKNGSTVLHAAAAFCQSSVTICLAQSFTSLLITENNNNQIPADLLCLSQTVNEDTLLRLQYHIIPAVAAMRMNKTQEMKDWLKKNTRPLPILINGQNLLHIAASFGNKRAVEYLLINHPELNTAYDDEGRIPYLTIGHLRSLSESEFKEIRRLFDENSLSASEDSAVNSGLCNRTIALIAIMATLCFIIVLIVLGCIYCKYCVPLLRSSQKYNEQSQQPNRQSAEPSSNQVQSFFDSRSSNRRTERDWSQEYTQFAELEEQEPWKTFSCVHYINADNVDITNEVFNLSEYESLELGTKSDESAVRIEHFQYTDELTIRLQRPVELAEMQPAREVEQQEQYRMITVSNSHPALKISCNTTQTKDVGCESASLKTLYCNIQKELNEVSSETLTSRTAVSDCEKMENEDIDDKSKE